jgi:putative flippase GtrA
VIADQSASWESPALEIVDATPVLDVVIPVHNEERSLVDSVDTVRAHLLTLPFAHRLTIADNASTDATLLLAHQLAHRHPDVRVVSLSQKGRGRALKRAWSSSTDLDALLPLVAPLVSGHSDLAIGSRLARSSRTTRGLKREVISRTYNALLRGTLRARFSDAQCGFKAIRREVAERLLPLIEDDDWFFDTELLILAEKAGLRIHEVPVDWIDDPDSRVDIVRTAFADLRGMSRLGWSLLRGEVPLAEVTRAVGRTRTRSAGGSIRAQVVVFALVGIASTIAYGIAYVALRGAMGALEANTLALTATAIANTAANRRFTFGVNGPGGAVRHHVQGLVVFGCGLGVTTGALWGLRNLAGHEHPLVEVAVLTAANLSVTVMRFVLMRTWIFRAGTARPPLTAGHD